MTEYTSEQEEIFRICTNYLKNNEIASITAPAGSGKTFTLVELSKKMPNEKILYLAYNKAIADESKSRFPKNVTVTTIHSLAYKELLINADDLTNDYNIQQIKEMFNCDFEEAIETKQYFERFLNSNYSGFTDYAITKYKAVANANTMFEKMRKREIKITHSYYLKEFSLLENKKSNIYDVILLDEAQDSNPVTIRAFLSLNGKKILVGDPHQSIYGFRDSVNAMQTLDCKYKLKLTYCFRCIEQIVDKANRVLSAYKEDVNTIYSKVPHKQYEINSRAFICRTNSKIVEFLAKNQENKLYNFALIKEPTQFFKPVISVLKFLNNEAIPYEEYMFLNEFKNEKELEAFAEYNAEISCALNVAKRYKGYIYVLLKIAKESYKNRKKDNITYLMTAHTSKGLEFDYVRLVSDFPNIEELKGVKSKKEIEEEVNLYYVAITRAKYKLDDFTRNKRFNDNSDE